MIVQKICVWIAVLAVLLVGAGQTLAQHEVKGHGEGGHTEPAAGAHGGEHGENLEQREEADAMSHVLDDKTGGWHLFESSIFPEWLRHIHLPWPLTKFMVLELIAAILIAAIYIPLGQRLRDGRPAHGGWDNAFEVLLTFIRNEVAKPAIGEHDADRFVPFLWTLFLFILFNNLLGLVPFGASATASIYVTGALALVVFFAIHGSAVAKMGFAHYMQSLWPHMDLPIALWWIKPLVFVIELVGVVVRNAVLAVRLFANMFAGHMVLATILFFIQLAGNAGAFVWTGVTAASVAGIIALSLLELFVAFLQAYIFVFLGALFMGLAMHPQH